MSVDAGLMEGGAKSAKFEKVNDAVEGVVESVEERQCTDIQTGKPLTWDDGKPKMQLVFTLQTSLREDDDDDGVRKVYAKKPGKMLKAIQDAVRAAKHDKKKSIVGGTLKVGLTGFEPAKQRGFSPSKLYRARFTPPAATADDWGNESGVDADEPGGDNAAPAQASGRAIPFS